MCGRYTLRANPATLAQAFGLDDTPLFEPRFNIAPTQTVPIIRQSPEGKRELNLMRWGLVPSWAEDKSIGAKLLNARSEGVATKPAFRSAFRKRRCLIPADGFYEWQKEGRKKQPFFISRTDGQPFAFAGLWDKWSKDEQNLETFSILTTEANELMRSLHDRMPVILEPRDYDRWLNPEVQDPKDLQPMLQPYATDDLTAIPVNPVVNSPKYDGPLCIERQEPEQTLF